MSNTVNTSIEILGKHYPVRCDESDLDGLKEAAKMLDQQMTEIKESGKVINIERIAIIAALNIAYRFLQISNRKNTQADLLNNRLVKMQEQIEAAINKHGQTEFAYIPE